MVCGTESYNEINLFRNPHDHNKHLPFRTKSGAIRRDCASAWADEGAGEERGTGEQQADHKSIRAAKVTKLLARERAKINRQAP